MSQPDHRLTGPEVAGRIYETSRYIWWNRRQGTRTEADRKFKTRRSALLYLAKRNSDSLVAFGARSGQSFEQLVAGTGLDPVKPFDLTFLDRNDAALEKWGTAVSNAFNVHKASEGTVFSLSARITETENADELLDILNTADTYVDESDAKRSKRS
jgi:hypothetical protein